VHLQRHETHFTKNEFRERIQAVRIPGSAPRKFLFCFSENHAYLAPSRARKRGASRSSRVLGAGCDGRRQRVRRARLVRTAESYGPDAPGLASSLRIGDVGLIGPDAPGSAGDGDNKAWSPGRVRRSLLTPSRREGRVAPVEPVVDLLVCFLISHARLRVRPAPAFPCALFPTRGNAPARLGRDCAAGTWSRDSWLILGDVACGRSSNRWGHPNASSGAALVASLSQAAAIATEMQ
jgi:hypothetical protein